MRVTLIRIQRSTMPSPTPEPEELILYPNKIKWVLYALASIGFSWLISSLQNIDPDIRGWLILGAVVFIACAVVCALQLWPNSAWLKLNDDGVHFSVLFRRYHYPWSVIKRFGIVEVNFQHGSEQLVSFWVEPNDKCISLNDSFGKKPEELVEILEDYWKQACRNTH